MFFQKQKKTNGGEHSQKKVLVINPEGSFATNPTIYCIVSTLVNSGFQVHILTPVFGKKEAANIIIYGYGSLLRKLKTLLLEKLSCRLCKMIVGFLNLFITKEYFDLIIGIDRQGIIEGHWIAKYQNSKLAYLSFEIMFRDETSERYKSDEIKACQDICFCLVQDNVRARLLSEENKIPVDSIITIPVSLDNKTKTSIRRLRDDLGVATDTRVAMLLGSLSSMVMFEDILLTMKDWPDNWLLIVHDRDGLSSEKLELAARKLALNRASLKKVIATKLPTQNFGNLGYLLNGIDVGFALYKPTFESKYLGKNIQYIGAASGKISSYLKYGVPVITNVDDWHSKKIQKFRYGVRINNVQSISAALKKIDDNQDFYSTQAHTFFASHLSYNLFEKTFLNAVENCLNSAVTRQKI